jgi:hypothetical protein
LTEIIKDLDKILINQFYNIIEKQRFLKAGYNMYTSLIDHTEKLTEEVLTVKKIDI